MDKIATARRMSRDQKELYNLYKKLLSYADQAQDTCTTVCWGAVITAIDPTPDDLTNPFVLAANQLCQDILIYERYFPLPEIDLTRELPLGEIWELTALIRRCLAFYETKKQQEKVGRILRMFLYNLLHDPERRPWLDEKLFRVAGGGRHYFLQHWRAYTRTFHRRLRRWLVSWDKHVRRTVSPSPDCTIKSRTIFFLLPALILNGGNIATNSR